ncbi:MAG TPA: PDZ domain-containing protein [Acidobacteriota bacterium]|nr:PDZ domain-containing protein [Acidobacteriota bacterium]
MQKSFLRVITVLIAGFLWCSFAWENSEAREKAKAGFEVIELTPGLADDLGIPSGKNGAVVWRILRGSPAETALLQAGDLITAVGSEKKKPTIITGMQSFTKAMDRISDSRPVTFTVIRGEKEFSVELLRSTGKFGDGIQPDPRDKPAVITVGTGSEADFRTVEGALIRSCPHDTILLSPGKYPRVQINRDNITIRSADPKQPAILTGIDFAAVTGATAEGFHVEADVRGKGTGITGIGKQLTVKNCKISGFNDGVSLQGTDIVIDGNYFFDQHRWAIRIGEEAEGSSIQIIRNLIKENSGGIRVSIDGKVDIHHNTIVENRVTPKEFLERMVKNEGITGIGIAVTEAGQAEIINNVIAYNNIGCLFESNSRVTAEFNNVHQHFVEETSMPAGGSTRSIIMSANSNFVTTIRFKMVASDIVHTIIPYTPSPTNINVGPLFVDPRTGDYRLAPDSPLIGKGRGGSFIGAFPPIKSGQASAPPAFGISAQPLDQAELQEPELSGRYGLRITSVKEGSPAGEFRIAEGDIIVGINNTPFGDMEAFRKLISSGDIKSVKVIREQKELDLTRAVEF